MIVKDYEAMQYDRLLEGYHTLVTGAGRGIGRATAVLFAQQGAAVAFTDIDDEAGKALEAELKEISPKSMYIHADMGKMDEVDAMCEKVLATYGNINVVVNNAGIFEGGLLKDVTLEALDRMYDVNVKGAIRTTQKMLPGLEASKGGTIVNVLSDYAIRGVPGVSLFAATKGAMYAFTRNMAFELSRYDIRVNMILPGMNITSHGDRYIAEEGQEKAEADFRYLQPIHRRGTAEDCANAILFLGSQMSRFINGEALYLDGGIIARAHKQSMRADETWAPPANELRRKDG